MSISGLGRTSIYKFMEDGRFPMSISLGERAIAWEVSEVEEWVLDKIEKRNKIIGELVEGDTEIIVSEVDVIKFIKNKFTHLRMSDAISWLIQAYK
jgi:prophage regulatory protein